MILPFDAVGEGDAVVLLHAGIADRTMWREQLAPFADGGHRAIALDLPGFGEAGLPRGPQAPWEDVLQTIDLLTDRPVALVGNSFGGAVALRVAARAPDRVAALALVSAPAPGASPSPRLEAAWEAEEAALARDDVEAATEAVVAAWTLPDASDELRRRVAAMQRRAFLLQQAAPETEEAEDPLEDRLDAVAHLPVRALCAAGEHDMPDFTKGAEMLAATLPNAQGAEIAGAGHLAPLEAPEAFRELVLGFLDGVG